MDLPQKFKFNPKEGIDNPVFAISDEAGPVLGPVPRLCVLQRAPSQSFGFHLRQETTCHGHVVRRVEPQSSAERGGLKDGDRLLEVNGEFVAEVSHHRVARKIQVCGMQLCLLVLSGEDYEQLVMEGRDLRDLARAHLGESCARPRLCHITRDPRTGLGISIIPSQEIGLTGKNGRYMVRVTRGGAAEQAGVRGGDRLLWINGAKTSELTYASLRKMVKQCRDHMTILVIDSTSESCYACRRYPILPSMATTHNLPHRPTTLHLKQGPDGYGFLLREERMPSGRFGQVLRDIDAGSPAEESGMRDGDMLLAVNGEDVQSLEHEDVILRVRRSGTRVSFTIIRPRGLAFYTKLGLSPLLFCDDMTNEEMPKDSTGDPVKPPMQMPASLPCPRLCIMERGPTGFGFHMGCSPNEPGTFISQVAAGGSGEKAGLFEGDVVVEINGINVEEENLEDVVALVKEGGESLRMLIVERWGYDTLKKNRMTIKPGLVIHSSQREETPKYLF